MLTYGQLAETFPPGDVIKEELEARGWTQRDLADIMGVQPSVVSAIVKGTKPISLDLARNLSAALGPSAQYWVNLDTAYRLNLPAESHQATTDRSELYKIAPVNEMIKRGWIESSTDVAVLRTRVEKFFDRPLVPCAARKSTPYDEAVTPGEKAWLYRVRALGGAVKVRQFSSKDSVTKALVALRPLMVDAEEVRRVPHILSEHGIALVVVEHLQQTRIDGVCCG